jgi:hypothetical protein
MEIGGSSTIATTVSPFVDGSSISAAFQDHPDESSGRPATRR